jgi:glycosyltransferase involved in cell wall biosynthesis
MSELLHGTRPASADRPTIWIGPVAPIPELPGSIKIGWITWETTSIPPPFRASLARFDELWVPSVHCKRILDLNFPDGPPVHVVPEGVDLQVFQPFTTARSQRSFNFQFLSIGKWEQRKGHDCLIRAFVRAFRGRRDVELLLCLTPSLKNGDAVAVQLERLLGSVPSEERPAVRLCKAMSLRDLVETYQRAHAFVLATRAEAWGLPILEAMSCGLPCLVTEYGGHLDFCTPDNSYLVPRRALVPAADPVYFPPDHDWGLWADPDPHGFERTMVSVVERYQDAISKAARARHNAAFWTWDRAARIAAGRIELLREAMGHGRCP